MEMAQAIATQESDVPRSAPLLCRRGEISQQREGQQIKRGEDQSEQNALRECQEVVREEGEDQAEERRDRQVQNETEGRVKPFAHEVHGGGGHRVDAGET